MINSHELFLLDIKLMCDCAWHSRMLGHPPSIWALVRARVSFTGVPILQSLTGPLLHWHWPRSPIHDLSCRVSDHYRRPQLQKNSHYTSQLLGPVKLAFDPWLRHFVHLLLSISSFHERPLHWQNKTIEQHLQLPWATITLTKHYYWTKPQFCHRERERERERKKEKEREKKRKKEKERERESKKKRERERETKKERKR